MADHHQLTESLEASPISKDGELLPVREQRGSLLQTIGVVELGKPQQQIDVVLSLTPLVGRRQHRGVQGTQLRITGETRQGIGRLRTCGGPFTGQLVRTP